MLKMLTPEEPEPLNLITINNDCKELIFEHLEWMDLISVADTSKQLYTSACRVFNRKYGSNARVHIGLPCNDSFCEGFVQPVSEPDICVPSPVMALKMLRNFGHLIINLHLEYLLFTISGKVVGGVKKYALVNVIEHYLAEYCSESLCQISLQGGSNTSHHITFENIQKPFINVRTLHTEECAFGKELPFNKLFPNLKTLKLGLNIYFHTSAIRVQFPTVENFSFFDYIGHIGNKFKEEDIEEMLKLNLQFENLLLIFKWHYSSNFIARIKQYCPNVQFRHSCRRHNLFSFEDFVCCNRSRYVDDRKTFTGFTELNPIEISDKYKNTLQEIFDLYWKRYR